jgi:hypothetical protein
VPAAIARFRLLGDEESAAEAYRSLGMHEEALTFLIDARNLALARAYAGQKSTAVSWQYLVDLVARYEREDADRETLEAVRAVILRLIAPAARTIPAPEAASGLDRIILLICGRFASVEDLPEDLLRVLVDTRALPVLMRLASRATRLDRELPKAYFSFLRILGEAVGASGDARLAAIQAFGARDTKRFERLAASIPLDNSTACILGHARGTYRGAVNLLMEAGAVDEAEGYCRINEDPVLAASWAERRGDFKQAVSLYREAGDLEGALRAARASGDGRKVARALEWLGRADEAVAVWRGLGREREVERILRKGGAAPGGGDSEGAGPGDAEEEEQ